MEYKVITLTNIKERVNAVKELENNLGIPLNIFNAIIGNIDLFSDFTHIRKDQKITSGMIGCLLSHIELLKSDFDRLCIFEDDCELIGKKEELFDFIASAPHYDILCLGTNEHVDYTPVNSSYVNVTRFWGTHALIITKKAAIAILKTYENYMKQHIFIPADWLYSHGISQNGLIAYAPLKPKQYFQQKIGFVSSITGGIRT